MVHMLAAIEAPALIILHTEAGEKSRLVLFLLLDEVTVEGVNGRHVEVVVGAVVPLFHHGEEVVLQVVESSDWLPGGQPLFRF